MFSLHAFVAMNASEPPTHSGFVTQYGGANSHMAIRAGELGLPAVIGAGEALFRRWQAARELCLDCTNQRVVLIA